MIKRENYRMIERLKISRMLGYKKHKFRDLGQKLVLKVKNQRKEVVKMKLERIFKLRGRKKFERKNKRWREFIDRAR